MEKSYVCCKLAMCLARLYLCACPKRRRDKIGRLPFADAVSSANGYIYIPHKRTEKVRETRLVRPMNLRDLPDKKKNI